jgi:guanylate kinase
MGNSSVTSQASSSVGTDQQLGTLLVISGPSGVGKDSVWQAASETLTSFEKAITCTTRTQREHEIEGIDYYFVSDAEFDRLLEDDQMLEWAKVHNARYGIPASSVLTRLTAGEDVVCVIDVQGAFRLRSLFPQALLVFIKPPEAGTKILKERLAQRGDISEEELMVRLKTAEWELLQTKQYDYEIINDTLEHAAAELCDIVEKEKAKRK